MREQFQDVESYEWTGAGRVDDHELPIKVVHMF